MAPYTGQSSGCGGPAHVLASLSCVSAVSEDSALEVLPLPLYVKSPG
jgi:hypothetical protein